MKIIAELLAGIDPTTTDLITNPNEHWLTDEANMLRLTKVDETIVNNYWNPSAGTLRIQDAGTTSLHWTLDGSNILRINV
jgi:hypothetical protein